MFNAASAVMGLDAAFTPSTGGAEQIARVLFNDPNDNEKLIKIQGFTPENPYIEYLEPNFPELYGNVRGGHIESVFINSVEYNVQKVVRLFDGKTYKATLILA